MSGIFILILRTLMAIALYAFVFWAIYALWNNLKTAKDPVEQDCVPSVHIKIQDGQSYSFDSREIIIGRDADCDLPLQDDTISAKHARLYFTQSHWWVEDLGSTNKTLLNGQVLDSASILVSDDQLHIGKIKLNIEIEEIEIDNR